MFPIFFVDKTSAQNISCRCINISVAGTQNIKVQRVSSAQSAAADKLIKRKTDERGNIIAKVVDQTKVTKTARYGYIFYNIIHFSLTTLPIKFQLIRQCIYFKLHYLFQPKVRHQPYNISRCHKYNKIDGGRKNYKDSNTRTQISRF